MKAKFNKREIAIYLLISGVLAILNNQTNHFAFVWFIYPMAIWGGIILIKRFIR
ncbi:MAG: 2TM domain-containing protein [Bacteroidales bacterium]|nr:2TM domain-containing protein [Bacteroidales bacterium]MDD4712235.1 2TM domain-containing protein [Bacteroidales bacterium]